MTPTRVNSASQGFRRRAWSVIAPSSGARSDDDQAGQAIRETEPERRDGAGCAVVPGTGKHDGHEGRQHRESKSGVRPVVERPGQHRPAAPVRACHAAVSAAGGTGGRAPPRPRCRPGRGNSPGAGRAPRSPSARRAPVPAGSRDAPPGTCLPRRRHAPGP